MHLGSRIQGWLRQNYPATAHLNDCSLCKGKFADKPSVLKHLGTEHGLFEQLLETTKETLPQKEKVISKPGFSDAFAQFLQKTPDPASFPDDELTSKSLEQASFVTIKQSFKRGRSKKVHSEACRICEKPFEDTNSKGEIKSVTTKRNKEKNHYISHFRDKLVNKYPSSFQGKPPFMCAKCNFVPKNSSQHLSMQKQAILSHIISCQNELETLIDQCEKRKSPSKVQQHVEHNTLGKFQSWRTSENCLVCNTPFKGLKRTYHYANHYKKKLEKRFEAVLRHTPTIPCPFQGCQQTFKPISGIDQLVEIQFFVHVGDYHDEFSNCGPGRKLAFPDTEFYLTIPERSRSYKDFRGLLSQRSWTSLPDPCLVCEGDLSVLDPSARVVHYVAHFKQLDYVFGDQLANNKNCIMCSEPVVNELVYKGHLVQSHIRCAIEGHIELLERNFKCKFCAYTESSSDAIVQHLVTKEFIIEVEVLKYMRGKGITPTSLIASYRKAHVEVVEDKVHVEVIEDEGQTAVKVKKPNPVQSTPDVEVIDLEEDDHRGFSLGLASFGEAGSFTKTEQKEDFKELQRFLSRARANLRVFIQKGPCYQLDPELHSCHECKKILQGSSLPQSGGTCCCFEGFRKLQYVNDPSKKANQHRSRLTSVGYLDPIRDPKPTDLELWRPTPSLVTLDLTEKVALFILQKVGDIFINMITDEKVMDDSFSKDGKQIIWKRPHPGILFTFNI